MPRGVPQRKYLVRFRRGKHKTFFHARDKHASSIESRWVRHGRRPGAGIMEVDDRQVATVFTVQPSPSVLDKPSIMKRYHRRRTCSHTSPRRSPTTVTLRDTLFVECRWWNDGWSVKTVLTRRSSDSMIPTSAHFLFQTRHARAFHTGRLAGF